MYRLYEVGCTVAAMGWVGGFFALVWAGVVQL